jgi:replicative DNA helicase
MEMSEQEIADRLISQSGSVYLSDVMAGKLTGDSGTMIVEALAKLRRLPLVIDDQGGLNLFDVASKARSVKRKHGLSLLVIDYLQLMSSTGDSRENRNNQLEQITRGMKALAKELGIPIIILSQLNRELEKRPNKRPQMSDLRDSGAIEQDADVILFVYRDEMYNPDSPDKGTAEIVIGKNRQGRTGMVRLCFQGYFTRFMNLSHDWAPTARSEPTKSRRTGDDY